VISPTAYTPYMTTRKLPKVLIVDDEDDIRSALRQMLEEVDDLDIVEAGDGQVALDALAHTQFDLMLLDINLPIVGGEEVLAAIKANRMFNRPTNVVVMSAQANLTGIRDRLDSDDVDAYLSKPFRYADLQVILADAIMIDVLLAM